jgi:Tol biopolymer transport system component
MDVSAGSRLGPYEILSRIGAGGMGEVFKARDTRLERPVAIKVLPAELAKSGQFRLRFEREAKTISQLNHPHICTLHDVGEDGGTSYLVMELLEGESLAERLARGPLPMSDVFRYGAQIADGLDRAHRAGVVHRDLKPANVMLTRSGAKLLDFGLAKSAEINVDPEAATQQNPLTQEGTILGTFQYMAPEQLEGLNVDARTDIFALGALLYEMATGVRAFNGSTRTSLIAAIVSQDPKPLSQLQPVTPPAFEHLVSRCLAKRPDDRWQSAHDVAEQLRWIGEAGSQAGVAVPAIPRRRSRERLAWSLAAVLALALGATAWLYSRAARESVRTTVFDIAAPNGMRLNEIGDVSGALVLSPDGTTAVYSVTDGPKTQLWLRNIATGEAKPLPGTENGAFPFWSPDSKQIGFFTDNALKRLDVAGGAPVTLQNIAPGRGGSWSQDGTILFTPDTQSALVRVPAGGGEAVAVTKLDTGKHTSHRWPWFLPDGRHFLFFAANHEAPTAMTNAIMVGSLDGAPPRQLMPSASNGIYVDGHLFFMRDATLMAQPMSESAVLEGEAVAIATGVLNDTGIWRAGVSVSENGLLVYHAARPTFLSTLRWIDRSGTDLGVVGEPDSYWDVDLSPNGEQVAISIGDPQRELWILDLPRKKRTRFPVRNPWTGSGTFSPDGATVYYDVGRIGDGAIMARRLSGGTERVVAKTNDFPVVRSISPDGRYLLTETRTGQIVRHETDGSSPAVALTRGNAPEITPAYSPDGKLIAFSTDQNGRWEVVVMSASDPAQRWQVSANGGQFPRWSRNGRELFYLDLSNRMTVVTIERAGDDLAIGSETSLFSMTPRPQARAFDVAPDGQRFLVNALVEQPPSNAVAVSNWKARLKR